MKTLSNEYRVAGGALLVAGTAIGAGMLGLPLSLAASGFFYGTIAFLVVWFLMNCSGRALVELSLLYPGQVNLISIAESTLGKIGKNCCWLIYLLFFYSVLAAYCSGGMSLTANLFSVEFASFWVIRLSFALIFITPFALAVLLGAKIVDYFNRFVMFGLLASFAVLAWYTTSFVNVQKLNLHGELKYLWFTFPLLITSFGFQGLIPSLKIYLGDDARKLKSAITGGSAISLVMYLIWVMLIFSAIPAWGNNGLVTMLHSHQNNPADAIINYLQLDNLTVSYAIVIFSACALLSSLLGVALSMFDFFADGLIIKRDFYGKLKLLGITFIPPIIFVILYPTGFLLALNYAGVFAAILLIGYPAMMAWRARYTFGLRGEYRLIGGKWLLGLLLLATIAIIILEILQQQRIIPIP